MNEIEFAAVIHNDSNVKYIIRIVLLETITLNGVVVKDVVISDVTDRHPIYPNMPSIRKIQLPVPEMTTFSAGTIDVKHQIEVTLTSEHEEIKGFVNYNGKIENQDEISLTAFLRKFLDIFHGNSNTPMTIQQFEGSF